MQNTIKLILMTLLLTAGMSADGEGAFDISWAVPFLDCVCLGGAPSGECLAKADPDSIQYLMSSSSDPANNPQNLISQVRKAIVFLEAAATSPKNSSEQQGCWTAAAQQLKYSLGFMMQQVLNPSGKSRLYILTLREVSNATYQWAQSSCSNLNRSETPRSDIDPLPNPALCTLN